MISISPRKLLTTRFRFDLCKKKRNPLWVPFRLSKSIFCGWIKGIRPSSSPGMNNTNFRLKWIGGARATRIKNGHKTAVRWVSHPFFGTLLDENKYKTCREALMGQGRQSLRGRGAAPIVAPRRERNPQRKWNAGRGVKTVRWTVFTWGDPRRGSPYGRVTSASIPALSYS